MAGAGAGGGGGGAGNAGGAGGGGGGGGGGGAGGGVDAGAAPIHRRAAVLGSPVEHSLSPVLHGAAYQALGLTGWHYGKVECREDGLARVLDGLGPEWVGLSLTMPLKRVALEVAGEVDPLAAAVGAANTLVLPGGGRRAANTDVYGIVQALRAAGVAKVEEPVVLGAGGTAQAALAALRELGATEPTVLVRDTGRTRELRAAAERLGSRPRIRGGLGDGPLPAGDVVISTLPAGAADRLRCPPGRTSTPTVVLDVVYAPWPTEFAAAAGSGGCRVVSGLLMLLHQAAAQVELMTGRTAPVDRMRAALDAAVRGR
jgi:shikimate dehydrogenase